MSEVCIDDYLARRFHMTRYNCWTLVREVWLEATGVDLGERTPEVVTREALLQTFGESVPIYTKLDAPEDPSLVLMSGPGVVPHAGVFIRGKVLQMRTTGASWLPVETASLGFAEIGFYK